MKLALGLFEKLVWPTVVLVIFWRLRDVIAEVLSTRNVTVKGGGLELELKSKLEAAGYLGAAGAKEGSEVGQIAGIVNRTFSNARLGRLSGAQILWVDDRPENNAYERKALQAIGLSFVISKSTGDAVHRVRERSFDAVISDLGRPESERAGVVLLEELRKIGFERPYILYTLSAKSDAAQDARRAGAAAVATTPVELFEAVIRALAG
ncbi:response regulator [Anaeromyxobacter sp. PSR-1]|uniref:response regulator n=1 Tax=Anaeromyxobacter sp. PSR-1 TaxID=1300915 RepID=UPI001364DDB2|nr:response regulator [Anaeromyxobacter sp. PSR-1]